MTHCNLCFFYRKSMTVVNS